MPSYKTNLVVMGGQVWSMDRIWLQNRILRVIFTLEPNFRNSTTKSNILWSHVVACGRGWSRLVDGPDLTRNSKSTDNFTY